MEETVTSAQLNQAIAERAEELNAVTVNLKADLEAALSGALPEPVLTAMLNEMGVGDVGSLIRRIAGRSGVMVG